MLRRLIERCLTYVLPAIYRVRLLGWWIRRPITMGARMAVFDGDRVLLVRTHGHNHWTLPGGAVKRREELSEAARREVFEETGCVVEVDRLLGMYSHFGEYKSDHVAIFVGHPVGSVTSRLNFEVAEARFFPLAALPARLDPYVGRRLEEHAAGRWGLYGKW